MRIGPDWRVLRPPYPGRLTQWAKTSSHARCALVGNWLLEWERTGDEKYKNLIETGMRDISNFKYGLFTGYSSAVGFDPNTGHLYEEEDTSPSFKESYHRQYRDSHHT